MYLRKLIIATTCAFGLSACASDPGVGVAHLDQSQLSAYSWELVHAQDSQGQELAGLQLTEPVAVTLNFNQDALSIRGGCNNLFGPYTLKGHTIEIKQLAATMMACPEELMRRDQELARLMQGQLQAQLQEAAQATLSLTTSNGDRLSFQGVVQAK